MQLGQLQAIDSTLTRMGYRILAISPDAPEKEQQSIDKYGLSYRLLSDTDLTAARAFGIEFQKEGKRPLPVPAVFIVGTDGVIQFQYINPKYAVRLDADVLLAAAKAALKQ